jgi:hypothetical protein
MPNFPSDYTIPPLQMRRGTYEQLFINPGYVPAIGELVYAIDTYQLYIGDGFSVGGNLIGGAGGGFSFGDYGTISVPSGLEADYGAI